MTRPVIGTMATRVAAAVAGLVTMAAAARMLGLEAVGRINLLVLGISFVMLLNNVVGGSGLVYLEPRHGTWTLRRLAYGWSVLCAVLAFAVGERWGLAPAGLGGHLAALALLEAVYAAHLALLLGRERYGLYNGLQLARVLVLLIAFAALLRVHGPSVMDYVHGLYIANASAALLSGLLLARLPAASTDSAAAFAALLRQGLPAQAANVLQLLNYRLSYFLVERFKGAAALGLWSITTQLAESAWLAPKSLGSVLYARVSNSSEPDAQRRLTLAVMKLAVGLAFLAAVVLIALPEAVYQAVFGEAAIGIGPLVLLLLPGLLAMAASQALSHYLSGSGKVLHNTISSGVGLAATVFFCYRWIPAHGADGAAAAASVAYGLSLAYQVVVFSRLTRTSIGDYLPNRADAQQAGVIFRRLLGR
jgi:O-antigen/teichoic acid export membrane protein